MSKTNAFWKSLDERIRGAGGQPGDCNFAADILDMASNEADSWTRRRDDALRIPDMLGDAARYLRCCANGGQPADFEDSV